MFEARREPRQGRSWSGLRSPCRRKKIYATIEELQTDLDGWLTEYNEVRTHQGRYCYGKPPMQTFLDAAPTAREKQIGEQALATASA